MRAEPLSATYTSVPRGFAYGHVDAYANPCNARRVAEKTDELLPEERKFAEEVTRLRKEAGWTQAQMADLLVEQGVSYMTQSTVSRVEKFQRPARVGEAEAWALILGRPTFRLMHPSPIDELIEASRFNAKLLVAAWHDVRDAMQRYARVRGDLDGTIKDLREDASDSRADDLRRWEIGSIVQTLETQRANEDLLPQTFADYVKVEAADGQHPTAP